MDNMIHVNSVIGNMSDDGVRDAVMDTQQKNPLRGKLFDQMMMPYTPWFMMPEYEYARAGRVIKDLSRRAAEGILQAVEAGKISDRQWLQIVRHWYDILATAEQRR